MDGVFVANLGMSASSADLKRVFDRFGAEAAEIVVTQTTYRTQTGNRKERKPRGFGYVYFSTQEQAEAALAAAIPPNTITLELADGAVRELRVEKMRPRPLSECDFVDLDDSKQSKPLRRPRRLHKGTRRRLFHDDDATPLTTSPVSTPPGSPFVHSETNSETWSHLSLDTGAFQDSPSTLSASARPWLPSSSKTDGKKPEDSAIDTKPRDVRTHLLSKAATICKSHAAKNSEAESAKLNANTKKDQAVHFVDGGGFVCH